MAAPEARRQLPPLGSSCAGHWPSSSPLAPIGSFPLRTGLMARAADPGQRRAQRGVVWAETPLRPRLGNDSRHLFSWDTPFVVNLSHAPSEPVDNPVFVRSPKGSVRSAGTSSNVPALRPMEAVIILLLPMNPSPPALVDRPACACWWGLSAGRSLGHPSPKTDCSSAASGSSRRR